jgi:glycerol-3-phosphate acyltransferase PlsY
MFNLNNGLLAYLYPEGYGPLAHFGSLLLVLIAAYMLGSVNSAILISKTIYHCDIRTKGSGNGGMTNMLRIYGLKAAGLTMLGDVLKTALAILIAGVVFGFAYTHAISVQPYCYLAGLFAVLGHVFPIYYKFKGGKGVLVTSAMALILSPVPFAILLLLFVLIVWMSKYVSLGSVAVAALYPVVMHGTFAFMFNMPMDGMIALTTIILACIIVWRHRKNLERIGNKTESKISFKKKKDE